MIHAFALIDEILSARRRAGRLLLGLDFDGTIAPIVPRVDEAELLPDARAALQKLAQRSDTIIAILSGRGMADLRQRMALEDAWYAGNHGLEIEGPGVEHVHGPAEATRASMTELAGRLESALASIAGHELEDKGLSLSVHYRRVRDENDARRLHDIVEREYGAYRNLRLTYGKRVVEVRPDIEWHKGSALLFLREAIGGDNTDLPTLFIGDDRTDEDGFRALGDAGYGIVVAHPPPSDTAARAYLASTSEVTEFLHRLDS